MKKYILLLSCLLHVGVQAMEFESYVPPKVIINGKEVTIKQCVMAGSKVVEILKKVLLEHESVINSNGKVVTQHAGLINDHTKVITNNADVITKHAELINDHAKVINSNANVITQHAELINDHAKIINNHKDAINDHKKHIENLLQRERMQYVTFAKQGAAYVVSHKVGLIKKGIEVCLPDMIAKTRLSAYADLVTTSMLMAGLSCKCNSSGVPFDSGAAWRAGRNGTYILLLAAAAREYLPDEYTTNWSEPQKAFAYAAAHVVLSAFLN